jgi:hypothetical protein
MAARRERAAPGGRSAVVNTVYIPLAEEPGLVKRFGEEYLAYMRNVPRWIPRARGRHDYPEPKRVRNLAEKHASIGSQRLDFQPISAKKPDPILTHFFDIQAPCEYDLKRWGDWWFGWEKSAFAKQNRRKSDARLRAFYHLRNPSSSACDFLLKSRVKPWRCFAA